MSDYNETIQEARKLAQSPQGQQLAALLQQLGGTDLQQAIEKAAAGDFTQAKQAIHAVMQDPQARKLLEQLGGDYGK